MSMNTNTINIYVTGKNLAGILEAVPPPAGMTSRIISLEAGTHITAKAQNVFILKKIPPRLIDGAKYVLCCKNHTDINAETLSTLYDLWPEPLTPSLLKFYYAKLLERISREIESTSEEIEHQKRMIEMARQDYLTGLATRWYLQDYIKKNQDERNVTCIYFDLDNFKKVNDTYGHQAGDRALAATAEMMQREFTDGFCARMGGDEFMIVLLGLRDSSEVERKVNTFMAGLLDYYAGTKTMKALSISVGIAQKTNGEDKSIDRLIHESDIALYEAKKSGRACCKVYSPSMEEGRDNDRESGRTYYLVDYENVHSAGLDGIHKLDDSSTVCIFYTKNANKLAPSLNIGMLESKAKITYIHAEAGAKNALDFQLSSYLGELIMENGSECKYFIVSKDSGFAALIPFWKERGVEVEIVSDISGNGLFSHDDIAQKVVILTGEVQLAPMIAGIIRHAKTKTQVNNSLQKLYKGTRKCGQVYRMIKPLIENKPGDNNSPPEKTVTLGEILQVPESSQDPQVLPST